MESVYKPNETFSEIISRGLKTVCDTSIKNIIVHSIMADEDNSYTLSLEIHKSYKERIEYGDKKIVYQESPQQIIFKNLKLIDGV